MNRSFYLMGDSGRADRYGAGLHQTRL